MSDKTPDISAADLVEQHCPALTALLSGPVESGVWLRACPGRDVDFLRETARDELLALLDRSPRGTSR